jgi:hypothetical protein
MRRFRRTTLLAVFMWALSLLLWVVGMLLWFGSASRHMPTRAGPVAAAMVSSEPRLATDGTGLEIGFSTVFFAVATVAALIAARQPQIAIGWILGSTGVRASFRLFADGYLASICLRRMSWNRAAVVTTWPPTVHEVATGALVAGCQPRTCSAVGRGRAWPTQRLAVYG